MPRRRLRKLANMSLGPVDLCSDGRICNLEVEWAGGIETLNRISVLIRLWISLKFLNALRISSWKTFYFKTCVLCFVDVPWDSTTVIYNWASSTFKRFSIDAFTFIGDYDKVSVNNGPLLPSYPLHPQRHFIDVVLCQWLVWSLMRHVEVKNCECKMKGWLNFRIPQPIGFMFIYVEDLGLGLGLGLLLPKKLKSLDLASLMKRCVTYERLMRYSKVAPNGVDSGKHALLDLTTDSISAVA